MIQALIVAAIALWVFGILWIAESRRAKSRIPQTRQKVYVSAGYWCDISNLIPQDEDESEEEYSFESYVSEINGSEITLQRNIRFNHIALMPNGEMELNTSIGRIPCPPQSEEMKKTIKIILNKEENK